MLTERVNDPTLPARAWYSPARWLSMLRKAVQRRFPGSKGLGLSAILAHADPAASTQGQMRWLESLLTWLRRSSTELRLKFLFAFLEQNPEWRERVQRTMQTLMQNSQITELLLQTDASQGRGVWGFFGEIADRLARQVLPRPRDRDLLRVFSNTFRRPEDALWIRQMPLETAEALQRLCGTESFDSHRRSALDALTIIGLHVSNLGISPEIRNRLATAQSSALRANPFLDFHRGLEDFVTLAIANLETRQPSGLLRAEAARAVARIPICLEAVQGVYAHLETSGVSVALVFQLESLENLLRRAEKIIAVLVASSERETLARAKALLSELLASHIENDGLWSHFQSNFRLLSRKIVERNGRSGEHYRVRDGKEYWDVCKSGLGGGAIVAVMTMTKIILAAIALAPLFLALGQWVIYAAGFIGMQLLHFTLATKLPSFTASHLARGLRAMKNREDVEAFTEEVAGFFRSQVAALAGNIVALIPVVIAIDLLVKLVSGHHVMSSHYAEHTFESLHPFLSGCLPLGALTGLELWISSLAGGAFENWIAFHRIDEAIAEDIRLKSWLGPSRTAHLAKWVSHNASGLGANITLGFMFGFMPVIGLILGMNLESRHVTISSASVVFSIQTWSEIDWRVIAHTVIGLLIVGAANLGVSFTLAFLVAARACHIKKTWRRHLFASVKRRILRRPLEFILPVRHARPDSN